MSLFGHKKEFLEVRDRVDKLPEMRHRPTRISSLGTFFRYILYAFRLTLIEKEMIVFILLQWASVALGYYLFVMMLYWIPPEVWKSVEGNDSGSVADIVLWVWMICCIGIAAFPLGIFSACMMVVHMIRYWEDRPSSVAACLKIVLPRAWRIWMFSWLDGYITVRQIIERLPKKNDRTTWTERMAGEALYYAWKLTTMGLFPNLVMGKPLKDTVKNTYGMLKDRTDEVLRVRFGYSLLCWIIGVGTYVWGIFNYGWIKERFFPGALEDTIADFYFAAGIPMLIAVGVIQLFIRPAYMIAIADIYGGYMNEKGEDPMPQNLPGPAVSAIVAFLVFCVILFVAYLYREPLGIMDMLATPYGEEYVRH